MDTWLFNIQLFAEGLWAGWTTQSFPWLFFYGVLFTSLAFIIPCNARQKIFRRDLLTDVLYYLFSPAIYTYGRGIIASIMFYYLFYGQPEENIAEYMYKGFGPLSELSLGVQTAVYFIVSDFILYWIHRWFHSSPRLWPFHAIHHSPETVDWLSTYRFHPVNMWISFAFTDVLMLCIGLSPFAAGVLGLVNAVYSPMVHANLNWSFGPLKYCFASPVFHRWHHTSQAEGMDKNFAPTFPIYDVMFGTFYMPEGRVPEKFGVPGADIPKGFLGQMIWPFKDLVRSRIKHIRELEKQESGNK